MSHESRIDGTDFGTVRGYLSNPHSPIQAVLHVKDRATLADLANRIDTALADRTGSKLSEMLARMVQEGTLKLSLRDGLKIRGVEATIAAAKVPRCAFCEVIYQPPFYLAHTPGLFEGKFDRVLDKGAARSEPTRSQGQDSSQQDRSRRGPTRERGR